MKTAQQIVNRNAYFFYRMIDMAGVNLFKANNGFESECTIVAKGRYLDVLNLSILVHHTSRWMYWATH